LVVPAAIAYLVQPHMKWFFLRPLSIPVLILAFCFLLPEIKGPTRWGDFSYGVYVLHYPIVQSLVALGLFAWSPWTAVAVTVGCVSAAAAVSWHYVERPWLLRTHAAAEVRRALAKAAGRN
jgi:peptidoglycan/LPS O-acetylase OafA/YrhL